MAAVFVFDIETVPDTVLGRRYYRLADQDDAAVLEAMNAARRDEAGHEFLKLPFHRIVAISAALWQDGKLKVWSLGEEDSPESELITRFYHGIEKLCPTLVSWNGGAFDLPVLHYRALHHGVSAPAYWELGEKRQDFRFNNYINRFHLRHIDLMDVMSNYQARAVCSLDLAANLCGFPGKFGMSGADVLKHFQENDIISIRNYCETDVLNTLLVFLRFQLMRGQMDDSEYAEAMDTVEGFLLNATETHFKEFYRAWKEDL